MERTISISLLILVVLIYAQSWIISGFFSKKIKNLEQKARETTLNNKYNDNIYIKGEDEISSISESFNLLLTKLNESYLNYHLQQIRFLQHERLIHLIVMLFVMFAFLLFLILFLFLHSHYFLILFLICLILTVFYVFHYFKLENTVIRWYFIYNENSGRQHD